MDWKDLSEKCYQNGFEAGRADFLVVQYERDKLLNENRMLRKANKELFDELARLKRGSISNWIPEELL